MSADEPFLARWSRRKHGATEPEGEDAPEMAAVEETSSEQPAPELTDEDMPPVESLGDDDDYSGFLSAGVSEALRRRALGRLFRSAKFNVTDGLDDYAEDFTSFAPLGDVVTADMKYQLERLREQLGLDGGGAPDHSEDESEAVMANSDERPGPEVEEDPADEQESSGKQAEPFS